MPSFLGIIICMVCLAGSTWAWFSASIQTSTQTIVSANFDISVTVNGEAVSSPVTLTAGEQYNVTLTAVGTASGGGYCLIENGAAAMYTEPVRPGESISFTFIPEQSTELIFNAIWGRYTGTPDILDGSVISV